MNVMNEYAGYLKALKKYQLYNNIDDNDLVLFKYSFEINKSEVNSYMSELNKENFENDFEHFKSILKWINVNLPHDGYNNFKVLYNAISIIKCMCDNNIGPSCMMLSFVLRDILESYGYFARIVQACPSDPHILDSHWKVLAYSNYFGKWIMLDPSWGAFCMKDDIPLSIYEIRNMLIKNENFEIINNMGLSKAHYHYFLCRYYFHFNSFEYNGFGMFENTTQKRINLSPIGFDATDYFNKRFELEKPYMKEWIRIYLERFHDNTVFINDEKAFWQKPC
jgi:hypothetical protein